jgi:voltage-gated potassium channel
MLRTTGLVAAAGALMLVVSQAVYRIEHSLPDSTFKSRGDALWWGIVTLTTIGYGDIYPKTTEGRVLAALLMFFGIGVIAALTGVVAEYYIRKPVEPPSAHPSARKLEEDVSALRTFLERIDEDVRHLRTENERLHAAIEQSGKGGRADGT